MRKVTVVGYDGSERARAALTCAARRAGPGARLVVAHAAEAPTEFLESAYFLHEADLPIVVVPGASGG